ncbi:MAG TPA: type II toxin-antitoxin system mRNA interferase toxin, RelE/StbE family [Candidatus Paceibacterota bacterium]|jgi:mRNA-degrading endonuclease YafQ of YafQ-DinJ toxin-antitoxin module|nr:type II toxin-antitoxin system mRNA interferase toxin, RelE/StbE family [Candidatus Paceibacterota bacterium]
MPIYKILFSGGFKKDLSKLPLHIRAAVEEKIQIFMEDPFNPRLNTHKLHGKDEGRWAFSVTYSYRVKFVFFTREIVEFRAIGTHGIYE